MNPEDEYIAASIDFIKQYHKAGYDLIADKIIEEGLEELGVINDYSLPLSR